MVDDGDWRVVDAQAGVVDAASRNSSHARGKWTEYTMEAVAQHCHKDDAWIVVDDIVYDMTPHLRNHEGWLGSGKVSTLLALLAAMGTDCTDDFNESHGPTAIKQMPAFQVGVLNRPNGGSKRVRFLTWEQIKESGRIDCRCPVGGSCVCHQTE